MAKEKIDYTDEDVYRNLMNLKIHEFIYMEQFVITRVIGGWIYADRNTQTSVFVPEAQHFGQKVI